MKKLSTVFITALLTLFIAACHSSKSLVVVNSRDAPKVIGPYSQTIKTGNLIYTSGQIGLSPVTNALAGDDIAAQTHQAMDNLKAILTEAGSDMAHVIKVTVFLKDLNDYAKVNDIYKDYFPEVKPARSAVQVARLPKDALIEIECVAIVK
jgi:2-iminobutanoate/2-iminopropanoate deaminase